MTNKETSEIVGQMVTGLMKNNKDYAIGYLEAFIVNLIEKHVKKKDDLTDLRIRMLDIGIKHLIHSK